MLLLEFQFGNALQCLHICWKTDLVAVIFALEVRANYQELSEGWPNFCTPLKVQKLLALTTVQSENRKV